MINISLLDLVYEGLVVLIAGAMFWMVCWNDVLEITDRQPNIRIRSQNCLHIATAADDVFLPGVIGLIKTTYRNSVMKSDSPFIRIQFEIFLTPNQSSESIKNLFSTDEAKENNWSYRLHLIEPKDVQEYKNTRFSWHSGEEKRAVGDSDTPHIYVIHLLEKRLKDVNYVWYLESDVAMSKDIVKFMMYCTRNVEEKLELLESPTKFLEEYGLPGKTFRENYGIAAFPRNISTVDASVYEKLEKLGYKVHGLPHFNSGILLLNLNLWRKRIINEELANLTKLNNKMGFWEGYGIQPALNLFFGDKNFYHLPKETTQMSLGCVTLENLRKSNVSNIESAYFLHWNGEYKPWLKNGMNKHLWALD